MNLFVLSLAYLRARTLNSLLNVLLLAIGVATITALILFSAQMRDRLARDARGIDLVVGAKGSPMQLILSSIYHVDVPTGNIPLAEAEALAGHPMVAAVIPLALGDNAAGFRIVGTVPDYPAHYGATPRDGRLWQAPFEATIGAEVARATGWQLGDAFVGSHGLAGADFAHGDDPYRVVGVLARTGTVIDRLVLTSIESVWQVHDIEHRETEAEAHADEGKPDSDADRDHAHDEAAAHKDDDREITALLVRYRTPLAAVRMPREINSRSALQAAAPALETARLLTLVGAGLDTLRGFGLLLIASAALGVFIALYNATQQRRYDLAVMRSLGASPAKLMGQILLEALVLALAGTVLGLAAGHVVTELLGRLLPEAAAMGLTGFAWEPAEFLIVLLVLAVGAVAALLPAVRAYRTDIAKTLATR